MNKKIYLILILIIGVVSIAGYFFYNQGQSGVQKKKQTCLSSGGEVSKVDCCKETGDFPNLCKVGACGCASEHSRQVKICSCGKGRCFNGEKCVPRDQLEFQGNFEEEGNLMKYGEEKKWALNYEEPGKPALVVTLEFYEESECDLAQGEKPCLEYEGDYGEAGDRVRIIGEKKNGVVEVAKLIHIQ